MSIPGAPIPHTPMQQALLDAALAVLREHGAAALTVRNVTARAGCSTSGIYTHFGGKDGLIEALYLDGFESFDRYVSARLDDGLVAGGRAYREWALANPTHYLVMWGRAVPEFRPSPAAAERAYQSFVHLVEAVRRTGAAQPLAAAYHAWATMHGYVMLELAGLGLATIEQYDALYEQAVDGLASALPNR
jgi:AcrR family transcriptional regulator